MRLYSEFLGEDAGEKFRAMSDSQFDNWKKANPGAASKADQIRSGKRDVKPGASSTVQTRTKADYSNDPLKAAKDKAALKGSDIVKAKSDQRQRQSKEKSALVKQQAQDKRAEQKKDQEEKKELKQDQDRRKKELQQQASQQKKEPGGALVKNMQSKAKKKPVGSVGKVSGSDAKLGDSGLKKVGNFAKKWGKKTLNLAKDVSTADGAPGIGGAPGDQRGLASRTSNL